ncbi:MAG: hypothetical protein SFV19_08665 [Rhodospirillaceae bacterium]|nr:hypothetical protein [Rhodospirillaceae bacterium]
MTADEENEDLATTQHYAAIGHVAAAWAYFEAVVDEWTLKLANIPTKRGICLTAQIAGSARKLDAFIALACLKDIGKLAGKLQKFSQNTVGLAERRNRVVHDPWDTTDILEPSRIEATARKKLRLGRVRVPTKVVLDLAIEVDEHRESFEALASEVFSAHHRAQSEKGLG